jgi:hypothetical protein
MSELMLSPLPHTWFLDLDGTIVKHNGYKLDGYDTLLDGAEVFLKGIPESDMVIFITSRTDECREQTERFLKKNGIRFDHIISNVPFGERILINDKKPSGLNMAIAINTDRDKFCSVKFRMDEKL